MNSSEDNYTFAGFDDITNNAEETVQTKMSNVPLEVKLKNVFERYCDIKEKREKYPPMFDEFGEEIPASKLNSLPLTLKNSHVDSDQKSYETFRKECNSWNDLGREQKVNIFKMMFLLRYEQEKSDESLEKSKTLAKMKSVEISDEKQGEKIVEENDLLDTQMAYPMDSDRPSKYVSQGKTQPDLKTLFSQQQQPTSSTPHRTLIPNQFINTILASPIAQSCLSKAIEQTPKSSLSKRRWPGMEFLGLKSVFELFTDDEDESAVESATEEPPIQAAKHYIDNAIEESQYTVSGILKICEEDEKNEQKQMDSSHDSSSKKRRLDIGSVRDLFTDDEEDQYTIEEPQFFDSSYVKNVQNRSCSSSNSTVIYDSNQAASKSFNESNVGGDKDKTLNSTVRLATGQKSNDLLFTYSESTRNLSTNENDSITKSPSTPKKTQDSNLFVYQGSPSLLNRSLSALNCYISQSQRKFQTTEPVSQFSSKILKTTNHTVDKSSTDLNGQLEFLNSQLSTSNLLDDFDDIKENFSSPYATCRSATNNNNRETGTLPMNGVDPYCDTDFTDDDMFVTCKVKSVNKFLVQNSNSQIFNVKLYIHFPIAGEKTTCAKN